MAHGCQGAERSVRVQGYLCLLDTNHVAVGFHFGLRLLGSAVLCLFQRQALCMAKTLVSLVQHIHFFQKDLVFCF